MAVCVCVASGPSFNEEQAALIVSAREADAIRVIVVNDNWRRIPNADVLYAADAKWWSRYISDVRAGFGGECWTQDQDAAKVHGLCHIRCQWNQGLSRDPKIVNAGSNSGYQAINLAYHFGASRIVLVGYDLKNGRDGRAHWFGDHPQGWGQMAQPEQWAPHFDALYTDLKSEGVDVVNCSIETSLRLPRGNLAAELA